MSELPVYAHSQINHAISNLQNSTTQNNWTLACPLLDLRIWQQRYVQYLTCQICLTNYIRGVVALKGFWYLRVGSYNSLFVPSL